MLKVSYVRSFMPLLLVFLISMTICVLAKSLFESWKINADIVMIGNTILFIAAALSFYFFLGSLRNNRAAVFMRHIYGGMMIRMFIVLIAALIYIVSQGKAVNKGAVFICMFLYFVYSFLEVSIMMKLSNKQKNAASASSD